ncbi:conserved hypothetical protein [Verticillium alfalfae VaMs.102]|uniref:Pentatricopeptide repeat protein n=1 Tax=Verticillium alfalfae (strain VaMs.102 / ATCC MYA-4576 / FGSC 10136) TaxID=526221 RepID=C9SHV2_VERA1|nr:conserved hypothetical protein [Verticillium alfalfae VaMs.102]EEY18525.1 conserved hypothetical protein [Verticillium alfalfae VaMs.102]
MSHVHGRPFVRLQSHGTWVSRHRFRETIQQRDAGSAFASSGTPACQRRLPIHVFPEGIQPASIQINGLIGAWQRKRRRRRSAKGRQARMGHGQGAHPLCRPPQAARGAGGRRVHAGRQDEQHLRGRPNAQGDPGDVFAAGGELPGAEAAEAHGGLWVAFREAEISPDAFMLNQLMESHSQFGDIDEAQELYRSLVHQRGVKPDSYTFMALWKMIGVNRLQILSEDRAAGEIRLTRETFAETVRFAHVFKGQSLDGQLARKMLHTFRRLKDNLGLVVAMRALRAVFGYVPPEVLGLEMVVGTTNLAWDTATARQKLRLAKRKIDKWVEDRQKQLGRPVRTLDDMTPEERGLEMMEYLESEYLPAARNIEDDLADVAREMGVYDIVKDH